MSDFRAKVTEILDRSDLLESLAQLEHDERWSGWHLYEEEKRYQLHQSGEPYLDRWNRLAKTPYSQLSERDKESDRIEVRKSLAIIRAALLGDDTE